MLWVGYVAGNRGDAPAVLTCQLGARCLERSGIPSIDDESIAGLGKSVGQSAAKTARSAGDNGDGCSSHGFDARQAAAWPHRPTARTDLGQ